MALGKPQTTTATRPLLSGTQVWCKVWQTPISVVGWVFSHPWWQHETHDAHHPGRGSTFLTIPKPWSLKQTYVTLGFCLYIPFMNNTSKQGGWKPIILQPPLSKGDVKDTHQTNPASNQPALCSLICLVGDSVQILQWDSSPLNSPSYW